MGRPRGGSVTAAGEFTKKYNAVPRNAPRGFEADNKKSEKFQMNTVSNRDDRCLVDESGYYRPQGIQSGLNPADRIDRWWLR